MLPYIEGSKELIKLQEKELNEMSQFSNQSSFSNKEKEEELSELIELTKKEKEEDLKLIEEMNEELYYLNNENGIKLPKSSSSIVT